MRTPSVAFGTGEKQKAFRLRLSVLREQCAEQGEPREDRGGDQAIQGRRLH